VTRAAIFAEFDAAGVAVDEGVSLRTDDALERLWLRWISQGRPLFAIVGIDNVEDDQERLWIIGVGGN